MAELIAVLGGICFLAIPVLFVWWIVDRIRRKGTNRKLKLAGVCLAIGMILAILSPSSANPESTQPVAAVETEQAVSDGEPASSNQVTTVKSTTEDSIKTSVQTSVQESKLKTTEAKKTSVPVATATPVPTPESTPTPTPNSTPKAISASIAGAVQDDCGWVIDSSWPEGGYCSYHPEWYGMTSFTNTSQSYTEDTASTSNNYSPNNFQTYDEAYTGPAPYIGNANTYKFHYASCSSVSNMNPSNKVPLYSRDEAVNRGFVPCKRCHP